MKNYKMYIWGSISMFIGIIFLAGFVLFPNSVTRRKEAFELGIALLLTGLVVIVWRFVKTKK